MIQNLNRQIEEKLAESYARPDDETLEEEIAQLENLAAALIRAKADKTISQITAQIDRAEDAARQALNQHKPLIIQETK